MPRRSRNCSTNTNGKWTAKRILLALLSLGAALGATPAVAQEFAWDDLQKQHRLTGGILIPREAGLPFHPLKVEAAGGSTVTILTIDRPSITGPRYTLTGQVRYEGVDGDGYLELWNHFPDGSRYFSRTLGEAGPMMKLSGTSPWRPFALPFDATGAPPPTRLVVNVVLPGSGTVYLGPLRLADAARFDETIAGGSPWTLDQKAGLWGGLAGGVLGGVGALIGLLTSLGRARRVVDVAATAMVIAGTVAFTLGVLAVMRSEPYAVYYPLLLVGFLAAVVPLGLRPSIRKRYEEIELRRMRAQDLR